MGKLLSALSSCKTVRVYVADTTDIIQTVHEYHHTYPVVSAALGRLLTAGSIMGSLLKDENELITLQINGDGPIGSMLVTADSKGNVKGYAQNNSVDIPLKKNGKLDVAGAVGQGTLSVIRDNHVTGVPYIGKVPLVSGEIAEDITSYFATSEQTPTVCALGVLVDKDLSIKSACGVLIQLLPGASENTISILEENIKELSSVSSLLLTHTPEEIAQLALKNIGIYMHISRNIAYKCDCSKEKCRKMLASLNRTEIEQIIEQDHLADIVCSFCSKTYHFSESELKDILEKK